MESWRSAKMLLGRSNPSWQWKSNISKLQRASAKVAFGATNKYPVTFQYAGWLTGILTMVYYNPHVVWSPVNPKQPGLTLLNWSIPLRSNAKKSLIQAFVNCSDHRGFVSRHGSCSLDCKMAMMRTRTWLLHAPCCSKNLTSISVVKQELFAVFAVAFVAVQPLVRTHACDWLVGPNQLNQNTRHHRATPAKTNHFQLYGMAMLLM